MGAPQRAFEARLLKTGPVMPVALIPVPFTSVRVLIATVSRFCGGEPSLLQPRTLNHPIAVGDVLRLALLAPQLRFPIDVNATVVARTYRPAALKIRYELADVAQVEFALGQLYKYSQPVLPVSLDVATGPQVARRCRLSSVSCAGATFDVQGELGVGQCTPDAEVRVQLPHQEGCLELPGHVAWVTPRKGRSRLHVTFARVGDDGRRMLTDIVYRFRLGAAPWTPRLQAPGL